jgi:CBS domain-containing protein
MNIAFFLLPKQEVVCFTQDTTLRQTLERMEYHRYTAVPIIDADGAYAGTVTEGDLLWYIKCHADLTLDQTNKIKLLDVPLRMNFVPVVDDMNRFIGIVRRSEIIDYCQKIIMEQHRILQDQ